MQPYFFPYIGYWQLVNSVDNLVILDDVQYIKRGWINRNRISVNNRDIWITVPLVKSTLQSKINEKLITNYTTFRDDFRKSILINYPNHNCDANILIDSILLNGEKCLITFLINTIKAAMRYLNIKTKIYLSSQLNVNHELKSENKILSLCKALDTDTYLNLPGGSKLYTKKNFLKQKIELKFIKPNDSILDDPKSLLQLALTQSSESVRNMLNKFSFSNA